MFDEQHKNFLKNTHLGGRELFIYGKEPWGK
jgi:hypothetical protein